MKEKEKKIKITKLPKELDPSDMFEERCFQEYGQCPFCGCTKRGYLKDTTVVSLDGNRGGVDVKDFHLRGVSKFTYEYKCNECGAEWESPKFPMKYLRADYYLKKGKLI